MCVKSGMEIDVPAVSVCLCACQVFIQGHGTIMEKELANGEEIVVDTNWYGGGGGMGGWEEGHFRNTLHYN